MPLFFGGIGCLVSGLITGRVARWLKSTARCETIHGLRRPNRCGVMFVFAAYLQNPVLAMIAMGLSSFGNDLVMPGAWGACMDVGGKFAGSLSGSMNMMGNFAGFLAPALLPGSGRPRTDAGNRSSGSQELFISSAHSWAFVTRSRHWIAMSLTMRNLPDAEALVSLGVSAFRRRHPR